MTRARGLHDTGPGRAACGVGFVAHLSGEPSHECVQRALVCLERMDHRGAQGSDPTTGDGAGCLLQIPDALLRETCGFDLPAPGRYGVAVCFLPRDEERRAEHERALADEVAARGQEALGWRDVPVEPDKAGEQSRAVAPVIRQLFIGPGEADLEGDDLERRLYLIRRAAEHGSGDALVVPSCSARTIVYKGMLSAHQLIGFYPDLRDERCVTALAVVHSRFSTNTFPSWALAQPLGMTAHNGEINTLTGNRGWMRARQSSLWSDRFGADLERALPIVDDEQSDSASLDEVVQLVVHGGRALPHALKLLIPEAHDDDAPAEVSACEDFHSLTMEPWDGPASVAFSDGRVVGATLDRNGLRPGRWLQTRDGWIVCASEAGTLEVDPRDVVRRGRLKPGTVLLVDVAQGTVLCDGAYERELGAARPWADLYRERTIRFDDLPEVPAPARAEESLRRRQLAFGYSQEDLRVVIAAMASAGKEPDGSMGADTALAVLSDREPSLFAYLKQRFAQVTNPAIDPVREAVVMSLRSGLGPWGDLLDEDAGRARQVILERPVLTDHGLARLLAAGEEALRAVTLDITWPRADGAPGLEPALESLARDAAAAVADGAGLVVLSDRAIGPERVAIPSLLATAAVHHHLVREGLRLRAGLVVESGEPREVHHVACLIGFGAGAVNPYLMLDSAAELLAFDERPLERPAGRLADALPEADDAEEAHAAILKALDAGLLKVMSKMGIATIQSYCGAQVFEAVGLDRDLVERWFVGMPSALGGVGLDVLAAEAVARHDRAWPDPGWDLLPVGGVYAWRRDGERHAWNPASVTLLQDAVDGGGWEAYERFSRQVDEEDIRRGALRGLLRPRDGLEPVDLDEVEPATDVVKRFSTGAMSLGSLSPESHETLAIAMNRLGGRSNTGEGGEDPSRSTPEDNGDLRRSAIKQVASARFGVTIGYLTDADQLQIKVAQGSKPGEGGQLPGGKVDETIARLRFSTPGVELISPPPHHDIYSIEDLKQLIHDLRCANPKAEISVKLAAENGVGTVAAGVVKAGADHVTVVGHDGGTGSSALSSIHSAGVPWELGLAETQQTLLAQGLRDRVRLQTDGQMRTGRDVVIAAALGAEEMAFSTAPLIANGCIMMRVCHKNTCPVGIATQDPELRRRFTGTPEQVVDFMLFVAEHARRLMAALGVRRMDELVGRVDLLEHDPLDHPKSRLLDLSDLLTVPEEASDEDERRRVRFAPRPKRKDSLDHRMVRAARAAIDDGEPVALAYDVCNVDRTVGGLLSHEIAKARGADGLADETIAVMLTGSAGQSAGAWLARGITLTVRGEVNDYAGKGLSGGVLAVRPFDGAPGPAEEQVIAGNTLLYGATSGRAFFGGLAGERFAVRNSGADAVVEGVGDHGCEYMTGGRVVVLGATGRNFAAGMSGGVAWVLDRDGCFATRANTDLVDLEALAAEDEDDVRALVAEHRERTGSELAARVLCDWDELRDCWVKVMPRDFKRVLEESGEGENDETSEVGAWATPAAS